MAYRFVWIAGMPRAGSTWLYNVVRACLAEGAREVRPRRFGRSDRAVLEQAQRALGRREPNEAWVFKTHHPVRPDWPEARFIVPKRDPRDQIISLMRFAGAGFDEALKQATVGAALTDYYRDSLAPSCRLLVDYGRITTAPEALIGELAAFLDIELAAEPCAGIARHFARERVAARISELDAAVPDATTRVWGVRSFDGATRRIDPATGFQTGHVSDYRDGDWRYLLSPEEIARIDTNLGPWLHQHGFTEPVPDEAPRKAVAETP